MTYDIFNSKAPAMPKPSKGTEFVKLLLSQASKDMREPLVPMAIPALSAHLTDVQFMYSDNKYYSKFAASKKKIEFFCLVRFDSLPLL